MELENCATYKNQPFTEGKEGKLGLPFNYAVFIVLSHMYTNVCSKKSIVNKQSTRLAPHEQRLQRTKEIITLGDSDKTRLTLF